MWKKIVFGFLILLITILLAGTAYYFLFLYDPPPISEEDRNKVSLMPLPASLKIHNGSLDISEGLNITLPDNDDGRLAGFLDRRSGVLKPSPDGVALIIGIAEESAGGPVRVHEDESYSLEIKDEIRLQARTVTGALRGLSTLYQLISQATGGEIPAMSVNDSPRYSWRGLMLDVSRHWMPREIVFRTLDAMELVKLNVLHLHLSDDQGFRVESRRFPRLHEAGSNGHYYTREDILAIIDYARDRGIRIVPEFDLPGHSKSWQIAYPRLGIPGNSMQFGNRQGLVFSAPVDPTSEYTYEFLDAFIAEMTSLFPDPYFHIGGDEVNPVHWLENDSIRAFMEDNNLNDAHALQTYFINRMNNLIEKHGKDMIGWEEIYQENLRPEIVIQSWKSQKSLVEAVRGGSQAILSAGYYLDLIQPAGAHYAVDPAVVPNAVTIRPDSGQWKMYDLTLKVGDSPVQSRLLIFDRNPAEVFGVISTLDQMTSFTGGTLTRGSLMFTMDSPFGTLDFEGELTGDSIRGEMSVAMISFEVEGFQTGGSGMPGGEPLPEIEYLPPLTDEEKPRILGGEACMWSEFVGPQNVESRIWPRTAAIAEKFWSPARLTTDIPDMYRRLEHMDAMLVRAGSMHRKNAQDLMQGICEGPCLESLRNLVPVLEEVKYHARMAGLVELDSFYLPDFPLDRLVDAVAPESLAARTFNEDVTKWKDHPENDSLRQSLQERLGTWHDAAKSLQSYVNSNPKLEDVGELLPAIEQATGAALRILEGKSGTEETDAQELLSYLENGQGYVVVAITPGLRQILE